MTEDIKDRLSLSDDEDNYDFEDETHLPEMAGTLCKWTNYIHGWQDRYIVLKDGTLSYYKSENETGFGCRGAVSLAKALLQPHEFDECRFDVGVNDCLWYLRANSSEERQHWMTAIELHKQADSGYGSENSLRRQGSMLSLTSGTSLSTASTSSFKSGRGFREKLMEMETFRDILCRQVDTLQNYFEACASVIVHQTIHDVDTDDIDDIDDYDSPAQKSEHSNGHHANGSSANGNNKNNLFTVAAKDNKDILSILQQHGAHAIDFKGESYTFKATTAGILATLSHCIDLMTQREESWKKRLEREVEKRKKLEEVYRTALEERSKPIVLGGPDYEEGPHSMLHEEEFFDAIDATLDKMDKEEEKKMMSSLLSVEKPISKPPVITTLPPSHALYTEIQETVEDYIKHADMTASDVASSWNLIAEEGEMKVFKREREDNGVPIDPVKAIHTVKGITGHELCHYFWEPSVRLEWEGTLESSAVIEWLSRDTMVTYQVHKRVWPATQRDSLFWSTIRHCPSEDDEGPDYWIVANHSTDHVLCPSKEKFVRIKFSAGIICQTVVQPPESGKEIDRSHLTCKIQYSAKVNPGGWAPASVIQVITKREVPKFLKNFTSYVIQKTKDQPIMF